MYMKVIFHLIFQTMLQRGIIILIPKLSWCQCLSFSRALHSAGETNSELVKRLLGQNEETWHEQKNSFLNNYDRDNLMETYKKLRFLGYSNENILEELRIMRLRPLTLNSRYRIYLDYGFDKKLISLSLLRHFVATLAHNIHKLKKDGYINKYKNVLANVNKKLKLENVEELDESLPLKHIHHEYLAQYLSLSLNMSRDEANYNLRKYTNLKCRSFKCIRENIDFLTKTFGFTHEKIRKHIYVLYSDKENALSVLKTYPKLGSTDFKDIIYSYPNIILLPLSNVRGVIECVEKFGYSRDHIAKVPMILLLNPSTLETRLNRIHTEDWYQPYVGLPRALNLAFSLPDIEKRRSILRDLNMKCVSMNLLACPKSYFNAYAKHGRDKLNGVDGVKYLASKLNVTHQEVIDKLQTHPYSRYVSLQQLNNSVHYLLTKFSQKEVYDNLQLVLYPMNVIESAVLKLEDTSHIDTTPCQDPSGSIKQEFILPLVLYLIEKENNFSGYGIWEEDEEKHSSVETSQVCMLSVKKKLKKPWTKRRRSVSILGNIAAS
uniref:Transcription termination factor 5, mitochondrial n=1 Tax=Cacopsylla melanoneura TaxID=428564 RepID=A0A8D8PVH7_9HEMI